MKNRSVMILGVVLIVLGVLALAYQGITYTKREKILDVGPLQATADREKTIPLPPLVGGLALAGGIALVIIGAVKSRSYISRGEECAMRWHTSDWSESARRD